MIERHAMELYKLMAPIVGSPWNRIVLHGDVNPGSYQFDFFFRSSADGKYVKCSEAAPFAKLLPIYMKMAEISRGAQAELRSEVSGAEIWSGFTFILTDDGDFTVHYEYGERGAGLSKEWREQYLV